MLFFTGMNYMEVPLTLTLSLQRRENICLILTLGERFKFLFPLP